MSSAVHPAYAAYGRAEDAAKDLARLLVALDGQVKPETLRALDLAAASVLTDLTDAMTRAGVEIDAHEAEGRAS